MSQVTETTPVGTQVQTDDVLQELTGAVNTVRLADGSTKEYQVGSLKVTCLPASQAKNTPAVQQSEEKNEEDKSVVRTVYGGMGLGDRMDKDTSRKAVKLFSDRGYKEIDTALIYVARNGASEQILGEHWNGCVATKAAPVKWIEAVLSHLPPGCPPEFAFGKNAKDVRLGLSATGIRAQMERSLSLLRRDSVNIYYLHCPDDTVPIEETLKAVNELHKEGKFKELGLSNYPASTVEEICLICQKNGYVQPTVYQGVYNALKRMVETELFPVLERFGIRFYAYNGLAGGLLTGKHKFENKANGEIKEGRFQKERYQQRYWNAQNFKALSQIKAAIEKHMKGTTMVEASYRWLYHHSALTGSRGDAVLLGASSLAQVESNLDSAEAGPLATEVAEAYKAAWEIVKDVSGTYFR